MIVAYKTKQMMAQNQSASRLRFLKKFDESQRGSAAAWKLTAEKAKAAGKNTPRFRKPFQMADLYERHIHPRFPLCTVACLWGIRVNKRRVCTGVDQVATMGAFD